MEFVFTKEWDAAVEKTLRDFYQTLSERERRWFAAVQAYVLPLLCGMAILTQAICSMTDIRPDRLLWF